MKLIHKLFLLCTFPLLLAGCTSITSELAQTIETDEMLQTEEQAEIQQEEQVIKKYFGVGYYKNAGLNPVISNSNINSALIDLLYEGLFELSENFTPQPLLAQNISYSANVYTIDIKNNIKFHSGAILTAEDVVYSIELAKNTTTSPYYSSMQIVNNITAVDGDTLVIELARPHSSLESLLDIPIIRAGTESDIFPDGTGTYKPDADGTYLIPNNNYHGTRNFAVETIELIEVDQSDAYMYSFETGGISINRASRLSDITTSFKGDVILNKVPTTEFHYLGVNTEQYPYNDPKVRQALSYFINRQSLADVQLQGCATAVIYPRYIHTSEEILTSYSIEKALDLLKQADIYDSDGDGLLDMPKERGSGREIFAPVIISNAENSFKNALVDRLILELNANGVAATSSKQTFDIFTENLTNGDFEIYYGETSLHSDFNIAPLISSTGSLNYGKYKDSGMDSAIYAVQSATKETLSTAQVVFEEYFLVQMPIIPLAFEMTQVVVRPEFSGQITPLPNNLVNGINE